MRSNGGGRGGHKTLPYGTELPSSGPNTYGGTCPSHSCFLFLIAVMLYSRPSSTVEVPVVVDRMIRSFLMR